jgi:hypothetical protein
VQGSNDKSLLTLQMARSGRCRQIDSRNLHKPDAGGWHFSLRSVKKASDMHWHDGDAHSTFGGFDRNRTATKKT